MKRQPRPIVYDYRELPEFLMQLYKYRKQTEAGFSYEVWAHEMGIKSRSYLRDLVCGQKPATLSILPTLIEGLKLNNEESAYLTLLVHFHAATTPSMRALFLKEIYNSWSRRLQSLPIQDISEFLSDPLIPQLFTYLSFEDSPSDIQTWAENFQCSVDRVQSALKCLIWQKLVTGEVDAYGHVTYRTENTYFTIPSTPGNSAIRAFHQEGIKQAQEALQGPTENRKLYSAFVALSDEQFQKAQDLIQDFNNQLLTVFQEKSITGKKVYRLNQQLLSVSEVVMANCN